MKYMTNLLARRAVLTPNRPAMTELVGGQNQTYSALQERVLRLATVLKAYGAVEGARVAILCRNRIAFFEVLFAAANTGAIVTPLNWRAPLPELSPLVAAASPVMMFCGTEDAEVAGALAANSGAKLIDFDQDYEELLQNANPSQARRHWAFDDIWYLLYTSGTTGQPKAVIQTYGMAHVNTVNLGQAIDLQSSDVTLNFLPLFHTAGINLHTLPTLFAGGHVLILPGFEADPVMNLLAEGRISTFFGVPAIYQALSLHPEFAKVELDRVRHWGCGGAPLADALVHEFARRGAKVANGMGMTETGPTVFLADPETATQKIGSVGKPQILCEARLVGAEGKDVAIGETGELWLSGPGITPGYWGNAEATAAALTPDGWLKTGDLARQDEDGCFYIVGRLKEMYISGAENVYPAEVENVLARHPAILEAAVLGVADARWGEVGHAFILLRPTYDAPEISDIQAWCRAQLAAFKVPKHVTFVDEFPRTPAGKIQKHLIPRP
ncbi:AMP-binding protein [Aquidulcibacter paucihalophilus]|uniref:AMP-binding protein n=1 Tax=Aquidulcibacter paucihalophilus TaxID=1978549 RepID=UPI0018E2E0FE|nr:AMP-binding protein [Aquidulcibacter paucihalophilus]